VVGKRKEHLDLSVPFRNWDGEEIGSEWDISAAWVITHSPHPFVVVGTGDRDSDAGAGATVLTVEETKKLVAALSEALDRIEKMRKVRNG